MLACPWRLIKAELHFIGWFQSPLQQETRAVYCTLPTQRGLRHAHGCPLSMRPQNGMQVNYLRVTGSSQLPNTSVCLCQSHRPLHNMLPN